MSCQLLKENAVGDSIKGFTEVQVDNIHIIDWYGAGVVAVLWVAHAAFLVSMCCCTIFKYIISHCFHIGDKHLMNREPIFCFITFDVWSQATVYAVYYTLFKCCAEGRIINFLMGFSIALIMLRLECLTM